VADWASTYVPLPSMAAVVYGAMFNDTGTRTGVSILYVSVPRCSKRCPRMRHQQNTISDFLFTLKTYLELDGEYGRKPLDR